MIYASGRWDVRGGAPAAATAFSDEDTGGDACNSPVVADRELLEIGYGESF